MSCWRRIEKVCWTERIINKEVLERLNLWLKKNNRKKPVCVFGRAEALKKRRKNLKIIENRREKI